MGLRLHSMYRSKEQNSKKTWLCCRVEPDDLIPSWMRPLAFQCISYHVHWR